MSANADGEETKEQGTEYTKRISESASKVDSSWQESRMLRLFNHYRHDWMNDIQILMGYIQLKKYDKLHTLMEKIKDKVQQESLISKLGIPELVLHVLAFQAEVKELRLEVRLMEEIQLQKLVHPETAAQSVRELLDCFKAEAITFPESIDNVLHLTWGRNGKAISLHALYAGAYNLDRLRSNEKGLKERFEAQGLRLHSGYGAGSAEWTILWDLRTDT